MNFIFQLIDSETSLDMCFQIERAKEYWDWKNPDDTFELWGCSLEEIDKVSEHIDSYVYSNLYTSFKPEEWCPIGTVEFVEKYLRTYFGDAIADKAMIPLNVPECFLKNKMNTGRYIENALLTDEYVKESDTNKYFFKDNGRIKNALNGIMTVKEAQQAGLYNVQISTLIKEKHNASEWRVFIHNGKAVDIKNYAGNPFVFPDKEAIDSYMYQLDDSLKEGTLDVYVDTIDVETYVMECHKFFSCGLYGFDQLDILPLMFWRTYQNLIK